MLVLERRDEEAIHIGADVRVVVIRSRDGRVKLGIEAPGEVPVVREELLPPPSLDDTTPDWQAADAA